MQTTGIILLSYLISERQKICIMPTDESQALLQIISLNEVPQHQYSYIIAHSKPKIKSHTHCSCAAQVCTFFIDCQSLRELRITSVIIIAIAQMRCGWDSSVMAYSFFSGRRCFKSIQHMRSRLPPFPLPPPCPTSSPWFPSPPPPPPPQLRCCWARHPLALVLWQGCSPKRRVIRQL
jgi:hypothetical protein